MVCDYFVMVLAVNQADKYAVFFCSFIQAKPGLRFLISSQKFKQNM